jgi:hypothetical protein
VLYAVGVPAALLASGCDSFIYPGMKGAIFPIVHFPMMFCSLLLFLKSRSVTQSKNGHLKTLRHGGHPDRRAAPFEFRVIDLISHHNEQTDQQSFLVAATLVIDLVRLIANLL